MTRRNAAALSRRGFLEFGSAGLLGLSLGEFLRLEAAPAGDAAKDRKADSVIMLWLNGGPSTIDMWDLKPDAPDGIRGEFKPISSSVPGSQVGEHLPLMAKAAKKATFIRSLQHTLPVHG